MRISDWISDVCSSGLARAPQEEPLDIPPNEMERIVHQMLTREYTKTLDEAVPALGHKTPRALARTKAGRPKVADWLKYIENGAATSGPGDPMATYDFTWRSEEHTSELQSLMRNSYAVFCLKKKTIATSELNTK